MCAVVDGQIQCHYGIAFVGSRECLHVFAGGCVGDVVPSVAVAGGSFNKLSYGAGKLITADIHRAVQSRIAVQVAVADLCVRVARVDAGGGGLQPEIAVFGVNETHIVLRNVIAVVVGSEVDIAGAVITSFHGTVGAVVIVARPVAEAVDNVAASDVAPEETVGERPSAVVVVNATAVGCRRVVHHVAVCVFAGARVDEDTTAKLCAVVVNQTVGCDIIGCAVNTATV